MSYAPSFHDNQPIGWFRRFPIYVSTILTGLLVLGLAVSVILATARISLPLAFSPREFLHGYLWQLLTFPLLGMPNFFTALGIVCFCSWATEVEKYVGRNRFLILIGMLIGGEALICLAWWLGFSLPVGAAGSYHLTAALLIAFATLYPGIEFWGWIPLKWFSFVSIVLGVLMYLPEHDWPNITKLLGSCGIAFGFIRYLQNGGSMDIGQTFSRINPFRSRPKLRVLPTPSASASQRVTERENESEVNVDALLDKIARTGMSSLTAKEKAQLEQARVALMRKEKQ